MSPRGRSIQLLMAEDDPDDRLLARDALAESRLANDLKMVEDGEKLMDYLYRRNRYADPAASPRPDLMLIDLNMPRKDGREAIREIKADRELKKIPIVVLTTSQADEDICRSYELGVASYISKPVTFEGLVAVMMTIGMYWFDIVELPGKPPAGSEHARIARGAERVSRAPRPRCACLLGQSAVRSDQLQTQWQIGLFSRTRAATLHPDQSALPRRVRRGHTAGADACSQLIRRGDQTKRIYSPTAES